MSAPTAYEHIGHTGVCAATGEKLTPGTRLVATLCDSIETGELCRLDFAETAWDSGARPESTLSVVGMWRTVVPEPNAKPSPIVGASELIDLFDQLDGSDQPKRVALRYIVSLQLMRKKQLICVQTVRQEGGGETMLVRRKGDAPPPDRGGDGPELTRVIDPLLDEAKLAELMDELDAVLTPAAGGAG